MVAQATADQPLVSVLMPVYNAEKYLNEAIDSVLDQTLRDFELICIDDGSTDGSLEILESYAKKDSRVKIDKNRSNRGIAYTANKLVGLARGQYLAKMDSDDAMTPTRLEKQVAYLRNHPDVVVVGGQSRLINEEGKTIGKKVLPTIHSDIYNQIFVLNSMHQPTIMINLDLVPKKDLVYDPAITPVDDYDLFFRLFRYGKFANLGTTVLGYRVYQRSTTMQNLRQTFALIQRVRARAVWCYDYVPTFGGWVLVALQALVMAILPMKAALSVLNWMRGSKHKDSRVWLESGKRLVAKYRDVY